MTVDDINSDLKDFLRAKNAMAADALRMLKARITNEGIAKQKDLTDGDVQGLIASEVKKRRDSAEAFEQGNRPELAAKEREEIQVLMKYMPTQLSEDEVRAIVAAKLDGQGLSAADFGKAMGLVMPELKGKADGTVVSKILKEQLQK